MSRLRFACLLCASIMLAIELAAGPSAEKKADDKPKVTVEIGGWQQTLKRVASHKGKIVVLDAWSTSCEPCKKEFPNLVALHRKYEAKGVVCMTINSDYIGARNKPPEYYRERVLKFLEKHEATFENFMSNTPSDELYEQMDLASIPAVWVFGREGKLVKRFDNEQAEKEEDFFTYANVTGLVEELLAAKPAAK
jgi:thiol-disulfide isomerase/thioredoxin